MNGLQFELLIKKILEDNGWYVIKKGKGVDILALRGSVSGVEAGIALAIECKAWESEIKGKTLTKIRRKLNSAVNSLQNQRYFAKILEGRKILKVIVGLNSVQKRYGDILHFSLLEFISFVGGRCFMWCEAEVAGFILHRDGRVTLEFNLGEEKVKAVFTKQDAVKQVCKLLLGKEPSTISRPILRQLVGRRCWVKVEGLVRNIDGFTVYYKRVVSIRKSKPEQTPDLLAEYLYSQFGFIGGAGVNED